jgi:lantibiotic modifying enzyme
VAPLLTGPRADRARAALAAIAAGLGEPDGNDASIGRGSAGVAVFYAELAAATGDPAHEKAALAFLDAALERAAADDPTAPLYTGTVGVGWALAYLAGTLVDEGDADDVDDLVDVALRAPWPSPDLIRGVAGVGVYALERGNVTTLGRVVDLLGDMSEDTPEGTTWYVDPATVAADRRARYPAGYYDVGMAHGQAGVVALLASAYAAGAERARPLLEGATAWLRAQRLPDDAGPGRYPVIVAKGSAERSGGRLAWCYGDAGVAAALLAAGRALHDDDVVDEAVAVALDAAARPYDTTGVVDAPLCHGSAGLLHVFGRLARETGEERLAEAARGWFDVLAGQLADGVAAGAPFGGVVSVQPPPDGGPSRPEPRGGFLEGAAGVGLALLGALGELGERPPDWDVLLLTRPPRP